jgi:hypothetical protein
MYVALASRCSLVVVAYPSAPLAKLLCDPHERKEKEKKMEEEESCEHRFATLRHLDAG